MLICILNIYLWVFFSGCEFFKLQPCFVKIFEHFWHYFDSLQADVVL